MKLIVFHKEHLKIDSWKEIRVVGYQQNEQFYQRFHLIKIKVFEPSGESTRSMNGI